MEAFDIIVVAILLYYGLRLLIRKDGSDPRLFDRYKEEAVIKYSQVVGACTMIGVLIVLLGILAKTKVIDMGIDFTQISAVSIIFDYGWAIPVIVSAIVAHFTVLKKNRLSDDEKAD